MTGPAPTLITAECFPTPALLLRTNDLVTQRTVREFTRKEAEAACALHQTLTDGLHDARHLNARAAVFTTAFGTAIAPVPADAMIRTFLLAAGTCLLDHPTVLLHDIDLRAYVRPAEQFVAELRAAQNNAFVHAVPWVLRRQPGHRDSCLELVEHLPHLLVGLRDRISVAQPVSLQPDRADVFG